MNQRIHDALLVALVLAALKGLFELTRLVMRRFTMLLESRGKPLNRDTAIQWGVGFLLAGLLLLPSLTAVLALFDNRRLPGGIVLHLFLVAVSIILFSLAEDLIRMFNSLPKGRDGLLPVKRHASRMLPLIAGFWLAGALFLSPVFYTALAILICVFYLAVLRGRSGD